MIDKNRDGNIKSAYLMFGLGAGMFASWLFSLGNVTIPNQTKVQERYIAPGKIEIICRDYDQNRENETYVKIDDTLYALKYNQRGNPELEFYKVQGEKNE